MRLLLQWRLLACLSLFTAAPLSAHQRAGRKACPACKPCPGSGVSPT